MSDYFKCSMLDCIKETAGAARNIALNHQKNGDQLIKMLSERKNPITQIVFVGSGTSSTSAITARSFVEKVTQLHTTVAYPNDFLYNTFAYDVNALYIFTSQTGTSMVCFEALKFVKDKGYSHVVISEDKLTPMAQASDVFFTLDCGKEEYPMRTVGYCASVLTQMMIGLKIGLFYGTISQNFFDEKVKEMLKISEVHPQFVEDALNWAEANRRKFLRSDLIVFTGADNQYGVALEGAMKVWETLQVASVGYELEEGIHGPNYGYNFRHCVIVLNDGLRENKKSLALARYMKEVHQNGFVVGQNVVDKDDFQFDIVSEDFGCILFVTVCQLIAYCTAQAQGRDLYRHHDNSKMESYFKTHQ